MDDLREQLQRTLGSAYTIERELGGGGMSRVFVATETRLGRRVVVKVLRTEIAAGAGAERFEREMALCARWSIRYGGPCTGIRAGPNCWCGSTRCPR